MTSYPPPAAFLHGLGHEQLFRVEKINLSPFHAVPFSRPARGSFGTRSAGLDGQRMARSGRLPRLDFEVFEAPTKSGVDQLGLGENPQGP